MYASELVSLVSEVRERWRETDRERERDQNCVPTAKVHSAGHTVLLSQRALKPLPSTRGKGEREGGSGRRRRRACARSCVCQVVCIDRTLLIRVHRPSRVRGWGCSQRWPHIHSYTHTHITRVVQSRWAVMALEI